MMTQIEIIEKNLMEKYKNAQEDFDARMVRQFKENIE